MAKLTQLDLSSYIKINAKQVSSRIALSASASIAALIFAAYLAHLNTYFQDTYRNHAKSFSYWAQVGDQFQLERSIRNFNNSSEVMKMKFSFASGNRVIGQGQDLRKLMNFYVQNGAIYHGKENQLFGSDGQLLGDVLLIRKIPLGYAALSFVIFFVLIKGISLFLLKRFVSFGSSISTPITDLETEITKADNLLYLGNLSTQEDDFREIGNLKTTLKSMATRIAEQQEKILQNEKIEYKEKLALQLAHDIRSPLTVLEMISARLQATNEDTQRLFKFSVDRIKSIASDLLDDVRDNQSQAGCNLHEVIKEIAAEKLAEHPNRLAIDILAETNDQKADVPPEVLKRILSNIINNSIEAASPEVARVKLSLEAKGNKAFLAVTDNGPGIPESIINKVFQRGFSSGKTSGNGLGLSYAKEKLMSLGGDVVIRTGQGLGARVSLILPTTGD